MSYQTCVGEGTNNYILVGHTQMTYQQECWSSGHEEHVKDNEMGPETVGQVFINMDIMSLPVVF